MQLAIHSLLIPTDTAASQFGRSAPQADTIDLHQHQGPPQDVETETGSFAEILANVVLPQPTSEQLDVPLNTEKNTIGLNFSSDSRIDQPSGLVTRGGSTTQVEPMVVYQPANAGIRVVPQGDLIDKSEVAADDAQFKVEPTRNELSNLPGADERATRSPDQTVTEYQPAASDFADVRPVTDAPLFESEPKTSSGRTKITQSSAPPTDVPPSTLPPTSSTRAEISSLRIPATIIPPTPIPPVDVPFADNRFAESPAADIPLANNPLANNPLANNPLANNQSANVQSANTRSADILFTGNLAAGFPPANNVPSAEISRINIPATATPPTNIEPTNIKSASPRPTSPKPTSLEAANLPATSMTPERMTPTRVTAESKANRRVRKEIVADVDPTSTLQVTSARAATAAEPASLQSSKSVVDARIETAKDPRVLADLRFQKPFASPVIRARPLETQISNNEFQLPDAVDSMSTGVIRAANENSQLTPQQASELLDESRRVTPVLNETPVRDGRIPEAKVAFSSQSQDIHTSASKAVPRKETDAVSVESIAAGPETVSKVSEGRDGSSLPGVPEFLRAEVHANGSNTHANVETLGPQLESSVAYDVTSQAPQSIALYSSSESAVATPSKLAAPSDKVVSTDGIARDIVDRARYITGPGETRIELELDPPELGRISVMLSETGDGISARLIVAQEHVWRALEQNLGDFQSTLGDAGIDLHDFSLSHDGSGAPEEFQDRSAGAGRANRNQTRRNLASEPIPATADRTPGIRVIDIRA